MAEFCFECFKKYIDEYVTEEDVNLEEDFCVECGCRKPCVISITPRYIEKCNKLSPPPSTGGEHLCPDPVQ